MMENSLLSKAGTLTGKKKRLLADESLTPDKIVQNVIPISRALIRATKRLHQFNLGGPGDAGETEEKEEAVGKDLVIGAMKKWMPRMVKAVETPGPGLPSERVKTEPSTELKKEDASGEGLVKEMKATGLKPKSPLRQRTEDLMQEARNTIQHMNKSNIA